MSKLPFAKKSLGQHWLEDKASLEAMVRAACITEADTILEIGPGTGTLTDELAISGAHVRALEFDEQRFHDLGRKYGQDSRVSIIQGDIRTFDLQTLPKDYKIVANIPYYLTANLLRKLVDADNKPSTAVLLVQKEVAQRIVARQGNLSQIAVFTQVYYQPTLGQVVSAHLFLPPPKVDSQILVLERKRVPDFEINDHFVRTVKAGFSEKRKKLRSSLAGGLGINKEAADSILKAVNLNPDARAQELSAADWQKLSEYIQNT